MKCATRGCALKQYDCVIGVPVLPTEIRSTESAQAEDFDTDSAPRYKSAYFSSASNRPFRSARFYLWSVSAVVHPTHAKSTYPHKRARRAVPRTQTSCRALPSSVDGATTITAPKTSSKDLSVPANLVPVSDLLTVPGGKGRAIELTAGQYFKITNTYGEQVKQHSTKQQWLLISMNVKLAVTWPVSAVQLVYMASTYHVLVAAAPKILHIMHRHAVCASSLHSKIMGVFDSAVHY